MGNAGSGESEHDNGGSVDRQPSLLITTQMRHDPLVRDYRNYNRQAERSIRTARSVGVTFNCGARSLVA
jgi:hypothetical protein